MGIFAGRVSSAVYGRFVDEPPDPEKAIKIPLSPPEKPKAIESTYVSVPHAAYVHETGEFVQINCCLTPWCGNFGKPALTGTGADMRLADGYEVDVRQKGSKQPGYYRDIPIVRCLHCKKYTDIRSNRSVAELMCQFTRKYAPALFCEQCSAEGLQADGTQNYIWDYATLDQSDYFTRDGRIKSGAARMICKSCNNKMTTPRYDYLRGIGGLAKNPLADLADMHAASFLSVSQFRRSHLVTDALPKTEDPNKKAANPRAGHRFYACLNKYHYIAVEWLSHYNNQIRYGDADVNKAGQAAAESVRAGKEEEIKRKEKKANWHQVNYDLDPDQEDEDAGATEESDMENVADSGGAPHIPGDLSWLGDFRDIPHVQTDTLSLSVKTPLENVQRQEMRLLVSVLAPSEYVLLATLDYSRLYTLEGLRQLDNSAGFDVLGYEGIKEDRELSMHAHLQKSIDEAVSRDSKDLGKMHAEGFGGRGVLIRRGYHALAHFYALEKIVSGLQRGGNPDILLSQDGEPDTLAACLWAFRERISRKECHLIASMSPHAGKKKPTILSRGSKSIDDLREELVADVASKQQQWRDEVEPNLNSSNDTGREAALKIANEGLRWEGFYLLSQGGNGKLPKNKKWVTANTIMKFSAEDAARLLQKASLYDVDSVCNQMRKRLTGFMRGVKGAARGKLSYLTHWEDPHRIQQLADIFAFGKNCLALHSVAKGFKPAIARLGLGRGDMHLFHYCKTPLNGETLIAEKFGFRRVRQPSSTKGKEKNHEKS